MFEVKLSTTGDQAEADDEGGALLAAKTLVDDVVQHYGARPIHRLGIIIARDGVYDGALTAQARRTT